MKITIVCAGKIKEKYLSAGIAEFMKRLRPFAQVEIKEILLWLEIRFLVIFILNNIFI